MLERGCLLRVVLVSVMGFVVVWSVRASPASGASLVRVPLRFAKGTGCVVLCFCGGGSGISLRTSLCSFASPFAGRRGLLGLGAFLSGAYSEG